MKPGWYVRFTCYMILPDILFADDLRTAAMLSIPLWSMEGWITRPVSVGGQFCVTVRIKEAQPALGHFQSGRILKIQNEFVRTRKSIYQILKVPPTTPETFTLWV